jgi:glutaryl-CoA dehydrogenase
MSAGKARLYGGAAAVGLVALFALAVWPAQPANPPEAKPTPLGQEIARVEAEIDQVFAGALKEAAAIPPDPGHRLQQVRVLGKLMLFDKRLSVNGNTACSFCHMPDAGFTGPVSALNATTVAYPGSVRDGDSYVLNGHKRWIGNASFADHIIVWARGEDGHVGGYVVDKGTPGYQAEVIHGKTALRVVQNAQITLDNVRVPADHRLAEANTFRDTEKVLFASRLCVAWEALGAAIAGYETARAYAMERQQFGYPIAGFQLVQEKLAGMVADITAMFCMMLRLAQLVDQGKATMPQVSLAKMQNCRRARAILAEARDILGGNGIVLDYGVARHLCDIEAIYTYEGTDSVQALILGREVTGFNAFMPPAHK